jgi:hypothetical protein
MFSLVEALPAFAKAEADQGSVAAEQPWITRISEVGGLGAASSSGARDADALRLLTRLGSPFYFD